MGLGNAVLQVPLSRLEMHPAPAPSCAHRASAFPEVYYGSGTFLQDREKLCVPPGHSWSARGACPLPSQEASSLGGHPRPPSPGRYGKAVLITVAVTPNATRCPGALQMQTSLRAGNASAASYSLSFVYQLSPLWCHPPAILRSPFLLATTPRQTVLRKN